MKNKLSPLLCGFRAKHNTQHALLRLLLKWQQSLDEGKEVGAVLMDLSKAFDSIPHELLIAKLSAYGFDKQSLNFIWDYLKNRWQRVEKKPEIVIFEGWCVGVDPQKKKDLLRPLNTLEKQQDKKRIWRNRVNYELKKNYKKIFNLIDILIFLKVPSFRHVYKWRLLQEKKLKITSNGKKTMNDEQIENFVMYYERITKHMLKTLPKKANAVINIDKNHRLKSIKFN